MSLHTIVNDTLVGRFHSREIDIAVAQPRPSHVAVLLSGASMRLLETGLALTAIATAFLIGLGR